jgi:hypothetical protein
MKPASLSRRFRTTAARLTGRLGATQGSAPAASDAEQARPAYAGERTYAFIAGCSRSGTTALTQLVNLHPDVAIGYERFALLARAGRLTPDLFETGRFLDFQDGDSHWKTYAGKAKRERVLHKYHAAKVIGDKIPQLVDELDQLAAFADPRMIFIVREPFAVAKSFDSRARNARDGWLNDRDFRVAVKEFNDAMTNIIAYAATGRPYLLLDYDGLFGRREGLEDIWAFLGVDPARTPSVESIFSWASENPEAHRTGMVASEVSLNADFAAFRQVLRLDRMRMARETVEEVVS